MTADLPTRAGNATSPLYRLRMADLTIALTLAAIVVVLGAFRMAPSVSGVYHDDGVYLATAKAMAEGHGYRLLDLPGAPVQTKYPFLYPVVLSLLWRAWPSFPENLVLLKSFSLLFSGVWISGAFLYLLRFRYGSRYLCTAACLVAGSAVSVGYFATQTLSEPLFSVCLVGALWTAEAVVGVVPQWRRDALTGLALGLPFLTRTLGAAGLIAALYHLRRAARLTRGIITGATLATGSWVIWVVVASGLSRASGNAPAYYSIHNYIEWWTDVSWRVPALNLLLVAFSTTQLLSEHLARHAPWPIAVGLGCLAWGNVFAGPSSRRLLGSTLTVYVGVIVLWPWSPSRFLVPLLPFLTFFLFEGLRPIGSRWPSHWRNRTGAALVVAAVGANVYGQVAVAKLTRSTGYPYSTSMIGGADLVQWSDYVALFRWLRNHTAPTDVLSSGLDSMLFLYTDRPAVRAFVSSPVPLLYGGPGPSLGSDGEFVERLSGVAYLVVLPMVGFSESRPLADLVERTRHSRPSCLDEVYRGERDRRFVVYAVVAAKCGNEPSPPVSAR